MTYHLQPPPERSERRSDPLWLPRGSVRAVIALGVIGVWAAIELGAVSPAPSDAVRSMELAVAAGYGFLRFRDARDDSSNGDQR